MEIAHQNAGYATENKYDIVENPLQPRLLKENGDQKDSVHIRTRETAASTSSQGSLRNTSVGLFNPLAKDFNPYYQFRRISCAIKVGDCRLVGDPFIPKDAAYVVFSADARQKDMPCIRLEINFNQASEHVSSLSAKPFVTVRWYPGRMIGHLDYRRVVLSPGDCNGDTEVIKLCPQGGPMESLFRMTWVSKRPMLHKEKTQKSNFLAPAYRSILGVLKNRPQPKEVTIWFLSPWHFDGTNLQDLVLSYSGQGFMQ